MTLRSLRCISGSGECLYVSPRANESSKNTGELVIIAQDKMINPTSLRYAFEYQCKPKIDLPIAMGKRVIEDENKAENFRLSK